MVRPRVQPSHVPLSRRLFVDQDRVTLIMCVVLAIIGIGFGLAVGDAWLVVLPATLALVALGVYAERIGLPRFIYDLGALLRAPVLNPHPPPAARARHRPWRSPKPAPVDLADTDAGR